MRRSMLFIPGNTPKMLVSCGYLGADAVIFDLEDAVSPQEKDAARILVRNAIMNMDLTGTEVIVRINAVDTDLWMADVDTILPAKPDLLMVPKVNTPEDIRRVDACLAEAEGRLGMEVGSVKLIALIETALGVENAYAVAASAKRVEALFLGAEDLTADLRCKRTKEGREIEYARGRLVCAARAAGVEVYDTPFTDVNDDSGICDDAAYAKSLGFSGKAAISPRHVAAINRAFSPTRAEVDHAEAVMAAIAEAKAQGKGAIALNGKMIDAPIVARAEQILAAARELAAKGEVLQ